MPVRTIVDLPDPLYERLRNQAEKSGDSIPSLVVRAIEQTYLDTNKSGERLTGPLVQGSGKLGPAFPEDENPHDVVFS
jgi:hypothetical protein